MKVVREYPRRNEQRLLLDPSCYEGNSTERLSAPPLLGRWLQEIYEMPVEHCPLDL